MIDCKSECKWYERCDAASGFKYHRENCPTFERVEIHVPVTNADRIRSANDEELATLLTTVNLGRISYEEYLIWLKQEAEDG